MAKEARVETFKRPTHQETDSRRQLVEQLITTRIITDLNQLHQILSEEYDIRININTLQNDVRRIGAAKDPKTGTYRVLDRQVTRFDVYMLLRHACVYLLNGLALGPSGSVIFLYPDVGTGERFVYLLELLREGEVLEGERVRFRDGLLGSVLGGDVVVVFLRDSTFGAKFFSKLRVLSGQESDLEFLGGVERDVVEKVLGVE